MPDYKLLAEDTAMIAIIRALTKYVQKEKYVLITDIAIRLISGAQNSLYRSEIVEGVQLRLGDSRVLASQMFHEHQLDKKVTKIIDQLYLTLPKVGMESLDSQARYFGSKPDHLKLDDTIELVALACTAEVIKNERGMILGRLRDYLLGGMMTPIHLDELSLEDIEARVKKFINQFLNDEIIRRKESRPFILRKLAIPVEKYVRENFNTDVTGRYIFFVK